MNVPKVGNSRSFKPAAVLNWQLHAPVMLKLWDESTDWEKVQNGDTACAALLYDACKSLKSRDGKSCFHGRAFTASVRRFARRIMLAIWTLPRPTRVHINMEYTYRIADIHTSTRLYMHVVPCTGVRAGSRWMDKGDFKLSERLYRVRQANSSSLCAEVALILYYCTLQASRKVLRKCPYVECIEPVRYRVGFDSYALSTTAPRACCSLVKVSSD